MDKKTCEFCGAENEVLWCVIGWICQKCGKRNGEKLELDPPRQSYGTFDRSSGFVEKKRNPPPTVCHACGASLEDKAE